MFRSSFFLESNGALLHPKLLLSTASTCTMWKLDSTQSLVFCASNCDTVNGREVVQIASASTSLQLPPAAERIVFLTSVVGKGLRIF